jgi:signal transduction histidine kinase
VNAGAGRAQRVFVATAVLVTLAPAAQARVAQGACANLPIRLSSGWEASDADPVQGVSGLAALPWRPANPFREPGPQGTVRWYRIRLDLSGCRGVPLAFSAAAIRDADEAYFDGVRIGGKGDFPPRFAPASITARVYPLPTDLVNQPGEHVLALRVYHAPSLSPVIRLEPVIAELAMSWARSWVDQTLAAVAGIGLSLATALLLFHAVQVGARNNALLAFAAFTVLVVVYLLSGHSAWGAWPVPPTLPFRIAAVSGALSCIAYAAAIWELLGTPAPARFYFYWALFALYAMAAAFLPDLTALVLPTRIARVLAFVCLAELFPPTVRAARRGHRGAYRALVGHSMFALGIVWLNLTLLPALWFYPLFALALALLAVGLYGVAVRQMQARAAAIAAERSRLAREIHDTLAQGLAGISIQLESVRETMVSSPAEAAAHLDRAHALVRASLTEARRSVWELRPQALEGGDLVHGLSVVVGQLRGRPLPVRLEVRGSGGRLPAETENNLLRIAQEAITNAIRHANAEGVLVELSFGEQGVDLRVRDDGCGFTVPPESCPADGHFGLLGMRERAERIGGRLSLRSRPGEGTEVSVSVPLPSMMPRRI